MIVIVFTLLLLNLALTGFILRRMVQAPPPMGLRSSTRVIRRLIPIQHKPITGPEVTVAAKVRIGDDTAQLSYWRRKSRPDSDPEVVMHFKDSGIFDGVHIPSNSYLFVDTGKIVASEPFEREHEPANVAIALPLSAAPTRNKSVAKDPRQPAPVEMSEEEQKKLAEEYELVDRAP